MTFRLFKQLRQLINHVYERQCGLYLKGPNDEMQTAPTPCEPAEQVATTAAVTRSRCRASRSTTVRRVMDTAVAVSAASGLAARADRSTTNVAVGVRSTRVITTTLASSHTLAGSPADGIDTLTKSIAHLSVAGASPAAVEGHVMAISGSTGTAGRVATSPGADLCGLSMSTIMRVLDLSPLGESSTTPVATMSVSTKHVSGSTSSTTSPPSSSDAALDDLASDIAKLSLSSCPSGGVDWQCVWDQHHGYNLFLVLHDEYMSSKLNPLEVELVRCILQVSQVATADTMTV